MDYESHKGTVELDPRVQVVPADVLERLVDALRRCEPYRRGGLGHEVSTALVLAEKSLGRR